MIHQKKKIFVLLKVRANFLKQIKKKKLYQKWKINKIKIKKIFTYLNLSQNKLNLRN